MILPRYEVIPTKISHISVVEYSNTRNRFPYEKKKGKRITFFMTIKVSKEISIKVGDTMKGEGKDDSDNGLVWASHLL